MGNQYANNCSIPFNKPFMTGNECMYIERAVRSGKISGNGDYTKRCQQYFQQKYSFKSCLLTSSCTDALEMAAVLSNLQKGDEVILPSFTFVSTANAFYMWGGKLVFADCAEINPNISIETIRPLVTPRTRVIVVVHYAGISCDMDPILTFATERNIIVVEDAAHSIDSYYKGRPLGSLGDLATFSFHETKNLIAGEGGMLVVNNLSYDERAGIIWEKGTNRLAFSRGETDKYTWVDVGSSYLPSELMAAFLWAQIESLQVIQEKRKALWWRYNSNLRSLDSIKLPVVPDYATVNGHLFYFLCEDKLTRDKLIQHLRKKGIYAVFHYVPLHSSPFFLANNVYASLPHAESFSDRLIRLPMYFELELEQVDFIADNVRNFFN